MNIIMISYMEDQLPRSLQITPNITLSDVDSVFLSQALIKFQQPPPDGNDEFISLLNNNPDIFTINESEHQIFVSGVATLNSYQVLLRNLLYSHNSSSGDPTEGDRTIEVSVTDDLNLTSSADFVTLSFISVNDAPIIDLNGFEPGRNYTVTFQEFSTNVSIVHPDVTILDVDNVSLTQMIITLTNPQNESEYLSVTSENSLLVTHLSNNINVSSILGSPIGLFVEVLLTLLYINSEDEPSDVTRIVSVVVYDGSLASEPVYAIINIELVNDVPILDLDSTSTSLDFQTLFIENGPPVTISAQPIILDPDSESVSQLRIQFERIDDISFISIGPRLRCSNQSSICSVSFYPPISLSLASDVISNITFFDNSNEPMSAIRKFYFSIFDGIAWSSSAKVEVSIQPVNDNVPTFINIPYMSFVEENQFNAFVFAPETMDIDAQNSLVTLTYTLKNCYAGCLFDVDTNTGVVTTSPTERIDREVESYYELTIEISDGFLNSTTLLFVNVSDQNDNCPRFIPDSYNYTLPLQTYPGTSLLSVFATDPDLPPNGEDSIRFFIIHTIPQFMNTTVFEIDPKTGVLYLVIDETELDPEIFMFSLVIGATGPNCSISDLLNNASITIFLVQNTMAPRFLMETFICIFTEGVVTGNCIIVASDDDVGLYGSFLYSLIDPTNTFSITDTSGVVTVKSTANLDFEVINSYKITVVAADFGRPSKSSSAELLINVVDVNDNSPVFLLPYYTAAVCENIPLGTTILQVEASDRDSGAFGEIEYYITPIYVPFSIEPNSGQITLRDLIDFEMTQSIYFNVSAIDGGRNRATVPVIIQILNNNDVAPTFSRTYYQTRLPENATVGSQLPLPAELARDADFCIIDQCFANGSIVTELLEACEESDSTNNNDTGLKYFIVPSLGSDFFNIDSQTGVITLARQLDFENNTSHTISIEVRDQDFMSLAVVMIYVNDTNDNAPIFLQMTYSGQVSEEAVIGTSVVQVMANDMDSSQNSNISFVFQGTVTLFVIDGDGIIYTNGNIDFEKIQEFKLTVTAIDMGLPRMLGTALVTIAVLDINDNAPMFFQTFFNSSILENIDIGSFVLSVGAIDLDSGTNAKLIYSIDNSTQFFINSTTGDIFVLSKIDFEIADKYSFEVRVTDQGEIPLGDSAQVEISILDINDNPISFDQRAYNISLPENESPTNLLQLSATDIDSEEITNKFFSLTNDSLLLPFIVTPVGTLRNTQPIDFESVSLFTLQAIVNDNGEFNGFSDFATIYVNILDKNDNPPIFDQLSYDAVIEEHSAPHTSVTTVSATDADSGTNAEIQYVIRLIYPQIYNSSFTINAITGLITVSAGDILDRESYPSVVLQVAAFNPHYPNEILENSTVNVSITLSDINDNTPRFLNTPVSFSISEDFTPVTENNTNTSINEFHRFVGMVSARDADAGQNSVITYGLTNSLSVPFVLNSSSGNIFTNSTLDRERINSYVLQISAADGGVPSLTSSIEVIIYVTDINDNIPFISERLINLSISEATSIGTSIYNISTIDYDIGVNADFSYTLISNDTDIPFMVSNGNFALYVVSELDRESLDFYSFYIQVSDNGTPSLNSSSFITITLLDVNDNPPILFRNTSDIIYILESAPVGVFVSAVYIIDSDLSPFSDSELFVRSQLNSFNISADGIISTRLPLDFETSPEHNITVFAQNIQQPYFISSLTIQVIVINQNDETPIIEILSSNSMFNYFEGHFSLLINPSIDIQDPDSPPLDTIASATIALEVLDTSYNREFIPNTGTTPYSCLNEDRLLKIQGCGTENVVLITRHNDGLVLFNGATLSEFSLSLDSSLFQYGEFRDSIPFISDDSGLTISLWIWYQPDAGNISSTILSKSAPNSDSSTKTLLDFTCLNRDFHFFYNSINGGNTIVIADACSLLAESWHHLAVVLNKNPEYWSFNLYIDGYLHKMFSISSFEDESGRLFLGAAPIPTTFDQLHNYFNGQINFLFFSNQVSHSTIQCSIGCGEALWLSLTDDNLNSSFSYNSGVLTITGLSSDLVYEQLFSSLYYINAEDEPLIMIQRLVYGVNDGVSNSLPRAITITLIAVNDYPPELNLGGTDGNFETTFIEESNPVSLVGSMNYSLTDRDSVAFTYIITVTILNPLQPAFEEVLYVTDTSANISTTYAGYVLTVTGHRPIPDFSMILSTITYQNLAGEMVGANRNISFIVDDNSERFSETKFCLITLVHVNDLPILSLAINQIRYPEGGPPIILSNEVNIQDEDNNTLSGARIEILNRLDGEEELLLAPSLGTITDVSPVSAEFDITNGILYLSGEAPLQIYSDVISQVQYLHSITSGNTTGGIREIRFFINDGLDDSESKSVFVIFSEIDNLPSIDLNGDLPGINFQTLFIEDVSRSILAVSPNLNIVDSDSTLLSSAQVILKNPIDNFEYISVSTLNTQLVFTYKNITGNLTIFSPNNFQVPISEFVSTLRTLTYNNPSEEPTPLLRTICFSVSDGNTESEISTSFISIMAVNDVPSIDLDTTSPDSGYNTSYTEGDSPVYITSRNVSVVDNDNTIFLSLSIRIFSDVILSAREEIITSTIPNLTIEPPIYIHLHNATQYTISLPNITLVTTVLESLQYSNILLEPRGQVRILEINVFDGINYSPSVFTRIEIVHTNAHSPSFSQSSYLFRVSENAIVPTFIGKVSARDLDSGIDGEIYYALSETGEFAVDNLFIVSTTGDIYSNTSFDRETIDSYSLDAYVFDSGLPQRSSSVSIMIIVEDENEFPPIISPNISLSFSVLEEQPHPISIGALVATDRDAGKNAEIGFAIVGGDGLVLFSITEIGIIRTNFTFDREINDNYELIISIFDQGTPSLSSQVKVTVVIIDINDNGPVFTPNFVSVDFLENEGNSYVITLRATDIDTPPHSTVTYQLLRSELFSIDSISGDVYTGPNGLDRELVGVHNLVGLAIDFGGFNGTQGFTGFVTLMVIVQDVNDNPPLFEQMNYSAIIAENSVISTPVVTVKASDADIGNYNIVRFSIGTQNVPFTIDNISGIINVSGNLDHESLSEFILEVIAYDLEDSSLNSTVIVTINVFDTNDNFPLFSSPEFSAQLPENTISNNIIVVTASDRDSTTNGDLYFSLINHQHLFSINSNSGIISNIVPFDYELTCQYNLLVTATDFGSPSLTSTVSVYINITDIEDIPPRFTNTPFSISVVENQPLTSLLNLTAEDYDGNCPNISREIPLSLIYSLSSSTQQFTLSLSGELSAAGLDRESVPTHTLYVSVTDSAGLIDFATITVAVLDVNDNIPTFPDNNNIFQYSVSEDVPLGYIVAVIPANDVDLVDQGLLVFSLRTFNPKFTINSTGYIIITESLDFESTESSASAFQVQDSLNNTIIGVVLILPIDTDDNSPELIGISPTINFTEGSESIVLFPNLVIRDDDINFQSLVSAQIILSSPEPFNSSSPEACICATQLCDPSCVEYLSIEVPLNIPNVSIVHQLGSKSISIAGLSSLGFYTNLLRTVSYNNLIVNPIPTPRTITLRVTDVGQHTAQMSISVNLVVLNQFPPLLDLDGFDTLSRNFETTFLENGIAIAIVGRDVSFMDPDRGTTIITRMRVLISNPFDTPQEYLFVSPVIVPAHLRLVLSNTSLTFSGPGSHSEYISLLLAIKYINNADEPNLHTRVIIFDFEEGHLVGNSVTTLVKLSGSNDFPPNISPSIFLTEYEEESSPIPIVSSDVQIIDQDTFQSANIDLVVEVINIFDIGGDLIQLAEDSLLPTGVGMIIFSDVKLMFSGNVSLESFEFILLNLRYSYRYSEFINISPRLVMLSISDDPTVTGFFTATTEVQLIAINDQQPSIQPLFSISLSEDENIGEIILRIPFNDADTHSISTPSFSLQDSFNQIFLINNNGFISLSSQLDFETVSSYTLNVSVSDSSISVDTPLSLSQVVITVIDINDNAPVFDPDNINITIREDFLVGQVVLTLQASDRDSGLNAELLFNLVNGVTDFSLDPATGILTLVNPLNFNLQPTYVFAAFVTNPNSSLTDFVSVLISVLDVNNNPPILSASPRKIPFIDGQQILALNSDLLDFSITDLDPNPTLDLATISINSNSDISDYLFVDLSLTELSVVGNSTKTLIISGRAPIDAYLALLSHTIYADEAPEPLNRNRSITFIVEDNLGPFSSDPVTLLITPQYINDNPPILDVSGEGSPFLTNFIGKYWLYIYIYIYILNRDYIFSRMSAIQSAVTLNLSTIWCN